MESRHSWDHVKREGQSKGGDCVDTAMVIDDDDDDDDDTQVADETTSVAPVRPPQHRSFQRALDDYLDKWGRGQMSFRGGKLADGGFGLTKHWRLMIYKVKPEREIHCLNFLGPVKFDDDEVKALRRVVGRGPRWVDERRSRVQETDDDCGIWVIENFRCYYRGGVLRLHNVHVNRYTRVNIIERMSAHLEQAQDLRRVQVFATPAKQGKTDWRAGGRQRWRG